MTENPKNFSAPTITCPGCNQRIALLHPTPFYIADALDTHGNSCPAGHCHLPGSEGGLHPSGEAGGMEACFYRPGTKTTLETSPCACRACCRRREKGQDAQPA